MKPKQSAAEKARKEGMSVAAMAQFYDVKPYQLRDMQKWGPKIFAMVLADAVENTEEVIKLGQRVFEKKDLQKEKRYKRRKEQRDEKQCNKERINYKGYTLVGTGKLFATWRDGGIVDRALKSLDACKNDIDNRNKITG